MNTLLIPHFGIKRQYNQLREELLEITDKVLSSGNYLENIFTQKFEDWLAEKTKTEYAVTLDSGSHALEIIIRFVQSLGKVNSEFIIPNLSYVATLNAFVNANCKNIQIYDTDKFGILDITKIETNKIYCLVGLYGLKPWHNKFNINSHDSTIVDGAQHWLVADSDIGIGMAISFDPTKNLPSTGNGGAIVTNNYDLYKFARSYKNNGKPSHSSTGTNSKMSELECAHLLIRTKYIDLWQDRREKIRQYYCNELREYVCCLSDSDIPHSNQKFVIYYPEHRNKLYKFLMEKGIEVRIHYEYTLSSLPVAKQIADRFGILNISAALTQGVISLPIYPEMSDNDITYIVESVKSFFK